MVSIAVLLTVLITIYSIIATVDCLIIPNAKNNNNNNNNNSVNFATNIDLFSSFSSSSSSSVNRNILSRRSLIKEAVVVISGSSLLLVEPLSGQAAEDNKETVGSNSPVTTQQQPQELQQQTIASNIAGNGRPYAPVEALLPAARCKKWIDQAYQLSSTLPPSFNKKNNNNNVNPQEEQAYQTLQELNTVLSNRPKLFLKERRQRLNNKKNTAAVAQITASISSANKAEYQINRSKLSFPNQVAAMLNQADVERQWGMLQYAESKQEQENSIRAAFNYFTQQLEFGDSYLLTANKEEKKRMIRNDELPSLTAVITSDLDLRDLYRNQLLTAIDDAQAEVAYQVKLLAQQQQQDLDLSDVITLMNQAHSACDSWFALISENDIQEAMEAISKDDEL